jgi:hypothetical protein
MSERVPLPPPSACPAPIAAAGDRAQRRFLEFFAAALTSSIDADWQNPSPNCPRSVSASNETS